MERDNVEIKINESDLRLLLFSAFRYSLGRKTHMPSFIVEQIMRYAKVMNKGDWKKISEEITNAVSLGDSCDIKTWESLSEFCKLQGENI